MRIISKFHDYYDGVQKNGQDQSVVYVRNRESFVSKKNTKALLIQYSGWTVSLLYLGFCGNIYKIYSITNLKDGTTNFFYDFETFKNTSLNLKITSPFDFNRKFIKSKFDSFHEENTDYLLGLFHEHQTPIFIIEAIDFKNQKLTLNPSLKDLEFQHEKDTFSTYQDISQFVSGVLNSPENKMIQISDKDKIHKHGFDKWSFRKLPDRKK